MNRNTIERICRFLLVIVFISGLSLSDLAEPAQAGTIETQPAAPLSSPAGRPLVELLNEDGTLDLASGYHGGIDPAGWQLVSGAGEPPRFAPLVPGDENWASGFHLPGIIGTIVQALVVDGDGILYVGGDFTIAGGAFANRIARWDGATWSALGSGLNDSVLALAVDGSGNLYVGGSFTTAGGIPANRIARWDGSAWTALGSGMDGAILALAVDGSGNLYAGGYFINAGGIPVNRVARWDGAAWLALNSGMNGNVFALAVDGSGNLYAGGWFTTAGEVPANRVARWDGAVWTALGSGMDNAVLALALDGNGNLYAGGSFTSAGGIPVSNIARWDGADWFPLGSGLNSAVYALAVDGSGYLYAGGVFTSAGIIPANRIARWNGAAWSALGSGMDDFVDALAVDGSGDLYAGGIFTMAGDTLANHTARWDGVTWSTLGGGNGMDNRIFALALDGSGDLYAGGDFAVAGATPANRIAFWDGTAWFPLDSGMNARVNALLVDGIGILYAGGAFTSAGGVPANYVARWDGDTWSALGSGLNSVVNALVVDGSGNLYAGGWFTTAGGSPASYIARWDGATWSALSSGMNGCVYALAVDGSGYLYAGGEFTTAGGNSANRIARWDGSTWSPLGSGMGGFVYVLAVDGSGNLYAGGSFVTAGGIPANRIARWDGVAWSALGSGMDNFVFSLAADEAGGLYAGGLFTSAGDSPADNIAHWDGTAWSPLGSGMNNQVRALAVSGSGTLYAGGIFGSAGDKVSLRIARSNWPPAAGNDSFTVAEDSPGNPLEVLDGDADLDGDALSIFAVGAPDQGGAVVNAGVFITYTPVADFYGVETFTYTISDGFGGFDTAAVSVTVTNVNDPPVASDDEFTVAEDSTSGLEVLANDSYLPDPPEALAVYAIGTPDQGGTVVNGGMAITYTPAANFYGVEIFTYTMTDGNSSFDTAAVTITITPVNDAPLAAGEAYSTTEDTPLAVAAPGVLGNDTDVENDPLSTILDSPPLLGELALAADGSFVYTPTLNFNGLVTFTYHADDGQSDSNVAEVAITVTPVNDAPVADAGEDQAGNEGQAIQFNGSYNDPGLLSIQAVTIAWDFGDGVTATGTLTPSHAYADDGAYTVTLTITDELGGAGTDTLLVTVNNVAPALTPIADQSVIAGQPLTLTAVYADPGLLDTQTAVVAWGDGITETINLAAGTQVVPLEHTYDTAGTYTASVTLTDDDGGQDAATFTVEVTPAGFTTFLPVIRR